MGSELAWNVRSVQRCCCCPEHPHLAQDKLMLIQNGRIINRPFIDDLSELHRERKRMLQRGHHPKRERSAAVGPSPRNQSTTKPQLSSPRGHSVDDTESLPQNIPLTQLH